jgi:hypothetical protein
MKTKYRVGNIEEYASTHEAAALQHARRMYRSKVRVERVSGIEGEDGNFRVLIPGLDGMRVLGEWFSVSGGAS